MANRLKTYLNQQDNLLPNPISAEAAVEEILALHEANGGATYSLYFGSQARERLYAVSVFPDRSFVTEGREISRKEITAFLHANRELFADPRCCVGVWHSVELNLTYLDVSTTLPDKSAVVALGTWYNQEGVFDLFRMEYIPTGGSGEPPVNMPPAAERLPPLKRGGRRIS